MKSLSSLTQVRKGRSYFEPLAEESDDEETPDEVGSVSGAQPGVGGAAGARLERKGRWRNRKEKKTEAERKEQLKILRTVHPGGLDAVTEGEWEVLEMAVDSAATETVLNDEMVSTVETKDGAASRRGTEYEVANGETIPNLGEKTFLGETEEGYKRNICAQVCDVNKALLSVKKVTEAGNRVIFDKDGSYIEDKESGEKIWMTEKGGMFTIKLWTKKGF